MPTTLPEILQQRFKIQKWKLYLVDMRDFHRPVIVKKHLDNEAQAIRFRDKYYNKNFVIVTWKEAFKYNLKPKVKVYHRRDTSKYEFPSHRVTQREKEIWRTNQRRKMITDKRRPKVNETVVWEILDDRPTFFISRLDKYVTNHWAYTEYAWGFKRYVSEFKWPVYVNYLSNIMRCLQKYYDMGIYDKEEVALLIYNKWKKRIIKHLHVPESIPTDIDKVIKEFKGRGFIEKSESGFTENDNYLETIHIQPTLVYPLRCWHSVKDKDQYENYIYDLQGLVGIPGFTACHVAGLNKRK